MNVSKSLLTNTSTTCLLQSILSSTLQEDSLCKVLWIEIECWYLRTKVLVVRILLKILFCVSYWFLYIYVCVYNLYVSNRYDRNNEKTIPLFISWNKNTASCIDCIFSSLCVWYIGSYCLFSSYKRQYVNKRYDWANILIY